MSFLFILTNIKYKIYNRYHNLKNIMKKLLIPFFFIAAAAVSYAGGSCCSAKSTTAEKPVAATSETKTEKVAKSEKKDCGDCCSKDSCKKS